MYGRFGDLGPLRRALPSNVLRMSLWNFGREYRALRRTVANGELASLVNSLTGAGALLSTKDMYIYILVEKAAVCMLRLLNTRRVQACACGSRVVG